MAKITIPIVTLSLNELLRMHPYARTRLKKFYRGYIEGAVHDMKMEINKLEKPKKRKVEIRSFRVRVLDLDNLIGGAKLLTDSLKELGLIWDDSPDYIDLSVTQFRDKYDCRTEIFIDEIK